MCLLPCTAWKTHERNVQTTYFTQRSRQVTMRFHGCHVFDVVCDVTFCLLNPVAVGTDCSIFFYFFFYLIGWIYFLAAYLTVTMHSMAQYVHVLVSISSNMLISIGLPVYLHEISILSKHNLKSYDCISVKKQKVSNVFALLLLYPHLLHIARNPNETIIDHSAVGYIDFFKLFCL